jgi:hypothetical protein
VLCHENELLWSYCVAKLHVIDLTISDLKYSSDLNMKQNQTLLTERKGTGLLH